jgi:hypothetical protein
MTREAVERVLEGADEFIVEPMNERTAPGSSAARGRSSSSESNLGYA